MASAMHVKIKANRRELREIGILDEADLQLLLSGNAFEVEATEQTLGKKRIFLRHPTTKQDPFWIWVEDQHVEVV